MTECFSMRGFFRVFGVIWLFAGITIADAAEISARELVEGDLRVVAKLISPYDVSPGAAPELEVTLVNTSTSRSHSFLNENSMARPSNLPYVFWSYEVRFRDPNSNEWIAVPEQLQGRYARRYCDGGYPEWERKIVELAPQDRLTMTETIHSVGGFFEFQTPGEYRFVLTCDFKTAFSEAEGPIPNVTDVVRDLPAFHLESNPIEVRVHRPLELVLETRKEIPIVEDGETKVSDMFDITLVNTSDEPLEVSLPEGYKTSLNLALVASNQHGLWRPRIGSKLEGQAGRRQREWVTLEPGEEVHLLRCDEYSGGPDGVWEVCGSGPSRIRAEYGFSVGDSHMILFSDWIAVPATWEE